MKPAYEHKMMTDVRPGAKHQTNHNSTSQTTDNNIFNQQSLYSSRVGVNAGPTVNQRVVFYESTSNLLTLK